MKLWVIWQLLRGKIVSMSNAPDKPLEIHVENNYNITINTESAEEDVVADFNLLASIGKHRSGGSSLRKRGTATSRAP